MSEPDTPRWLSEVGDELRREAPVRAAWRARLLEEVARAPRPSTDDAVDDRLDEDVHGAVGTFGATASPRRSIVLSPAAGLAAAIAFVTLGAGIAYTVLASGPTTGDPAVVAARLSTPPGLASDSPGSTEREVVRFELSAPRASRVMLVGSFNEWNPSATPLVRNPATGMWTVALRLTPGRHVYAFVVDGDVTADPAAPRAADDDFGSTNSVVFVSAPRT